MRGVPREEVQDGVQPGVHCGEREGLQDRAHPGVCHSGGSQMLPCPGRCHSGGSQVLPCPGRCQDPVETQSRYGSYPTLPTLK